MEMTISASARSKVMIDRMFSMQLVQIKEFTTVLRGGLEGAAPGGAFAPRTGAGKAALAPGEKHAKRGCLAPVNNC